MAAKVDVCRACLSRYPKRMGIYPYILIYHDLNFRINISEHQRLVHTQAPLADWATDHGEVGRNDLSVGLSLSQCRFKFG